MRFSKVDIIGDFNKSSIGEYDVESLNEIFSRESWGKEIEERDPRNSFKEFGTVAGGEMRISEALMVLMVMMVMMVVRKTE